MLRSVPLICALALSCGCSSPAPDVAAAIPAPALPPSAATLAPDGLRLAYSQAGPGNEKAGLLFVHGWCGQRGHFAEAMEHFGSERPVAALDLGGHGESGRGREDWTFDVLAADVVAVLDQLGWDDAILVGHSLGGPLCVVAAGQAPERVRKVVVVNALYDVSQKPDREVLRAALPALEADFAGQSELLVGGLVPASRKDLRKRLADDYRRQDSRVALAVLKQLPDFDMAAALAACPVPVTAINGSDKPTRLSINRRSDPDFEAQTLDGLGPYLLLEDPERFFYALASELD